QVQGHGGWAAQGQYVGNQRLASQQARPRVVPPRGIEQGHVKRFAVQGDDRRVHAGQEGAGLPGYRQRQAHAILDPHQLLRHHCRTARVHRTGQVIAL
ncbi:hypothetical protein GGI22_008010, partial [Coemansia erecta]